LDVKAPIRGFLSYGGASTDAIDLLEAILFQEARYEELSSMKYNNGKLTIK